MVLLGRSTLLNTSIAGGDLIRYAVVGICDAATGGGGLSHQQTYLGRCSIELALGAPSFTGRCRSKPPAPDLARPVLTQGHLSEKSSSRRRRVDDRGVLPYGLAAMSANGFADIHQLALLVLAWRGVHG